MPSPASTAGTTSRRPRLQMIPLNKLVPTPDNRRRPLSKQSLESLGRSVAREGVLQPIVVRPHPSRPGYYEIRAGERRWRAARLAGVREIPAIIRALDDQSALSVTIAENLQRLDLSPLERADTLQQAIERGYDLNGVAARVGLSPRA